MNCKIKEKRLKRMKIQVDILKSAIYDMKEIHGISYAEMQRESGVHNISRIMSGAITPYSDTWNKLHATYPEYIPEPVYVDKGGRIYQTNSPNSNAAGHSMTVTNHIQEQAGRLPELQVLENLIMKSEDPQELCLDLIAHVRALTKN